MESFVVRLTRDRAGNNISRCSAEGKKAAGRLISQSCLGSHLLAAGIDTTHVAPAALHSPTNAGEDEGGGPDAREAQVPVLFDEACCVA